MSAAFTKGEWRTGPAHVVRCEYRDEQDRHCTQFIAECCNTHGHEQETEANANLIVAAPSLYEALLAARKRVAFHMPRNATRAQELALIDAALARARGEQIEGAGE